MILGTTVEIISEFSDEVSGVIISIYDKDNLVLIDEADMDLVSGYTYRYLFQSLLTHLAGRYTLIISAVSSGYTIKDKDFFTLDLF